ncbi:hypothetical protein D3C86_1745780 [compost metagenome]
MNQVWRASTAIKDDRERFSCSGIIFTRRVIGQRQRYRYGLPIRGKASAMDNTVRAQTVVTLIIDTEPGRQAYRAAERALYRMFTNWVIPHLRVRVHIVAQRVLQVVAGR